VFTNVDEQFRGFAKVVIWVGIVTSCLMSIVMIATISQQSLGEGIALGLVYLLLGLMITWAISLALRGLGLLLKKIGESGRKTSIPR
jgi:hypothetical protein